MQSLPAVHQNTFAFLLWSHKNMTVCHVLFFLRCSHASKQIVISRMWAHVMSKSRAYNIWACFPSTLVFFPHETRIFCQSGLIIIYHDRALLNIWATTWRKVCFPASMWSIDVFLWICIGHILRISCVNMWVSCLYNMLTTPLSSASSHSSFFLSNSWPPPL